MANEAPSRFPHDFARYDTKQQAVYVESFSSRGELLDAIRSRVGAESDGNRLTKRELSRVVARLECWQTLDD